LAPASNLTMEEKTDKVSFDLLSVEKGIYRWRF